MNGTDFMSILPLLICSAAALVLISAIAIRRNHLLMYILTLLSFLAAFAGVFYSYDSIPHIIEPLFIIDGAGIFSMGLILLAALAVTLLSYGYFEQRESRREEYYVLLVLATLGALVLVISRHFASLFLGLETLSVSLYGLIAYLRRRERSDEAGIKYLILAAFSSAFLLFGMALIYAQTGNMSFPEIGKSLAAMEQLTPLLMAGFGMMIVGIGFKLAVVPFHMWTADVYEGAPAPVTAFIATVSKGGMMILLLRFFAEVNAYRYPVLLLIFSVIAIISMFAGNLLALMQQNVKRLLAYSSVAHLGYLLVAFIAVAGNAGGAGVEAVIFYLVAYFITTLGAFGVLTVLSDPVRDAEKMEDYKGLLWNRPWLALVFTAMLLSLAGIPLTAGFIGKFYVVAAGVDSSRWLLVIMLVINSVIGLFYYLRLVVMMLQPPDARETSESLHPAFYIIGGTTLAALLLMLVWFGIYPGYLMDLIREMQIAAR
ncbi:NADH dehydrogenase subunit N [Anseongella ginsenosidimutans]|uniref:NADH-quinone oxidoreductase subunit N n=1 Tax=Anseongella ginsenosidimutans TaxID=496056 RepID=A0A4R3KR41_9SPHI|nr:NADH-quinone oxidoreductase subunit N [Anseongella ginsenosidimutans]QEC52276.1 NADH-quinone oxidoreductase subunit N [Anseongella ginsenosidimutans]TCS86833.1 NADH dehydrogenase subunit N [Anseongella ginsenosidimutans]